MKDFGVGKRSQISKWEIYIYIFHFGMIHTVSTVIALVFFVSFGF